MAAYGLYTHIQSNKRRSVALLIGLFLLVYVMVFAGALLAEALTTHGYNGRYGGSPLDYLMRAAAFDFVKALPFATIGTVIWIFIAYKFHQSLIDAVTGARVVSRTEEPRLYNLLENLCISRGITMPTLRIADDEALNAFATGLNDKQYSITVTHGLIEALDDQEIEAVLGHELTHIRNGDVRMLVIAVVIAGALGFFGELVFRIFFQNMFWGGGRRSSRDEGKGGASVAIVIALALIALVWILSILIRFALSRQREYLADSGSVELTKNPDAMISALRKISGHSHVEAPDSMRAMFIDYDEGVMGLFATHPPIDARIKALVQFGGGRDVAPPAAPAALTADLPEPHDAAARGKDAASARLTGEPGPWGRRPGPWA